MQGFLNEEAVRIARDVYAAGGGVRNFMYMYERQLIIPSMTFTRNESVVRWTFATRYRASATQYPELQVWRENTTGTYVKVGSTEPVETAYLNVYEYVLDPPLQVLAGDVLGIYQPSSANSHVQLLFLWNSSYVNWCSKVSVVCVMLWLIYTCFVLVHERYLCAMYSHCPLFFFVLRGLLPVRSLCPFVHCPFIYWAIELYCGL